MIHNTVLVVLYITARHFKLILTDHVKQALM